MARSIPPVREKIDLERFASVIFWQVLVVLLFFIFGLGLGGYGETELR